MDLKIYNTLTRQEEIFKPITEGKVGMYVCGPTVYNTPHIGNMRAYIFADTLRRVLEFAGYDVNHVMNLTDVGHLVSDGDHGEDKMEKAAREQGLSAQDIAKQKTETFFKYIQALNIKMPKHIPAATGYLQEQLDMANEIMAKGYAYKTDDGVYFDTRKYMAAIDAGTFKDHRLLQYNALNRNKLDENQSGARVEGSSEDFALWKFSKDGEQRQQEWGSETLKGYPSDWPKGYPGWHLECSAMSKSILGNHFDIHTGGVDHIGTHHTNEIAQSQCANEEYYVNYWLHNNHLQVDGKKMSKSDGTFVILDDIPKHGYSAVQFRFMCLLVHYRSTMNFTWTELDNAAKFRSSIQNKIDALFKESQSTEKYVHTSVFKIIYQTITDHLMNDLDTRSAIIELDQSLKRNDLSPNEKLDLARMLNDTLGLVLSSFDSQSKLSVNNDTMTLIGERAAIREKALQASGAEKGELFAQTDALRLKILEQAGIWVNDTKDGPEISFPTPEQKKKLATAS